MSEQNSGNKPSIVLVHGAWADGTSWQGVIPKLEEAGYTVTAVQNPLTSLADDVATTKRVIDAQAGPVIVVGHSYGGAVIGGAAADNPNVKALVYIAAFALDVGETGFSLLGPDEHSLGHQRCAMTADVVGDFAAAGRMADEHNVTEIERLDELGQIVGVLVHIVALPGLVRAAMTAPVVGDDPIAVLPQEQHLAIPGVGAEWPAVAEDNRLTCAPVPVIDLRSVFGSDLAHGLFPLFIYE